MTKEFRKYSVYVIALDDSVINDKRFREANPCFIEGKPCVYVGMTGRSPEERFRNHKAGYKSSRYPRRYGLYLRRRLFEKLNPMTFDRAKHMEAKLAGELREKGYGVWQN